MLGDANKKFRRLLYCDGIYVEHDNRFVARVFGLYQSDKCVVRDQRGAESAVHRVRGLSGNMRRLRQRSGDHRVQQRAQVAETHQLLHRLACGGRFAGRIIRDPVCDPREHRSADESPRLSLHRLGPRGSLHHQHLLPGCGVRRSLLGDTVSHGIFAHRAHQNCHR